MYTHEWNDKVMPLGEALDILQQVLRDKKAFSSETAINQAMLGKYIKAKDERFRQEIPRLITNLVQSAKIAGIVTLEKHAKGPNHNIYLGTQVIEQPKKERRKSRSGDFIELFKRHNFGPFATQRDMLFQNIISNLCAGEVDFAKLLSSAVTELKQQSDDKNQSWRSMHVFLENLARRNKIFSSESGLVSYSLATVTESISALSTDWKSTIEKDLVLFLIEHINDVQLSDAMQIAGAIYADRSEKNIDLITCYFSSLSQDGRIEEKDGFLKSVKHN